MLEKEYFSTKEVAAYFGIEAHAVRERIRKGQLGAIRMGRKLLRVRKADIEEYERKYHTFKTEA